MAKENEPAKLLLPYVQRADELQKHEPLVAYYCNIHSLFRCRFFIIYLFLNLILAGDGLLFLFPASSRVLQSSVHQFIFFMRKILVQFSSKLVLINFLFLVKTEDRLYAVERGLKIPQSERTKTTNSLLLSLMNQLEKVILRFSCFSFPH